MRRLAVIPFRDGTFDVTNEERTIDISGLEFVAALAVGLVLGGFYFTGLWLTLRYLRSARRPYLLLLVSFVGRTAVVLAGFYFVLRGGHWERMLVCMAGFIAARVLLVSRFGRTAEPPRQNSGRMSG